MSITDQSAHETLKRGIVIPAHPLALDANRKLNERRQRALSRYYIASGAGGVAVGVHTTQFAIRNPGIDLLRPVLTLAAEEMQRADESRSHKLVRVAGLCGPTEQAIAEAELAVELGYHFGLLSLAALKNKTEAELLAHCRTVAETIPLFGFYLQSAVGGRPLSFDFWCRFCEIEDVAAIKLAPFNRYQTLDVVRAVIESGRADIALYTGNDDNIVVDLITTYRLPRNGQMMERRIVGGLLGHWAAWTRNAALLLDSCAAADHSRFTQKLLQLNGQVTDCNAAFFDAANNFAGCIAGLHEVLRRQGLLAGIWCLNPRETLSAGQLAEIDRVYAAYPHLNDDAFVAEHLDDWLSG